MIKKYLRLNDRQMRLNKSNLEHIDSRILVNTALTVLPNVKFSQAGCPTLIKEYKNARVDVDKARNGILLKDRDANKLDLFDGSRYLWQTYYLKHLEKLIL
jgi:hypothetical protein